jgi:YD repeat-containing protein
VRSQFGRYDAQGNQTAVTNSRGFTTHYAYDALNRAIQATDALNGIVQNEYDNAGNLISQTDELGHRTQFIGLRQPQSKN